MGDSFAKSLEHLLRQTGFENVDSVDFSFYRETENTNQELKSIFKFLSSHVTDANCVKKEHLERAEKLKSENVFLDESEASEKLKYSSQLGALPPITERDVDCCKTELLQLNKQQTALESLNSCLEIELDRLKSVSEAKEAKKKKCDDSLITTVAELQGLFSRFDLLHVDCHNSIKLYKNKLKDMSFSKFPKKDYLFQLVDNTNYRANSAIFKDTLLKLVKQIGSHHEIDDHNLSLNTTFALENVSRIFNIQVPSSGDEFEKTKRWIEQLCLCIFKALYLKTMEDIECQSKSAVLDLLMKMNKDIEDGILQVAVLKEDMLTTAKNRAALEEQEESVCSSEAVDLRRVQKEAVRSECVQMTCAHAHKEIQRRLEGRVERRQRMLTRLNSVCAQLQSRVAALDLLWMALSEERLALTTTFNIHQSLMTSAAKQFQNYNKRMNIMEKMVEKHSGNMEDIEIPGNLECIRKLLSKEEISIEEIPSAVVESFAQLDGIGSKLADQCTTLSKLLDDKCIDVETLNQFLFHDAAAFDVAVSDAVIEDVGSKVRQVVDSIEMERALVEEKKKYFESQPYAKHCFLAWASFLTNKQKLNEITEKMEEELKNMRGNH